MKIYQTILLVLTVKLLYDGFSGEFACPTFFDWIKWTAYILLLICYLINSHRRKHP
nr:MAG TPA: hypothetical protein [Caudoviricetes sp.]